MLQKQFRKRPFEADFSHVLLAANVYTGSLSQCHGTETKNGIANIINICAFLKLWQVEMYAAMACDN